MARNARIRPVYVEAGVWYDHATGDIQIRVTGFKDAVVAVSSKHARHSGHPELYELLSRILEVAGAPYPSSATAGGERL